MARDLEPSGLGYGGGRPPRAKVRSGQASLGLSEPLPPKKTGLALACRTWGLPVSMGHRCPPLVGFTLHRDRPL